MRLPRTWKDTPRTLGKLVPGTQERRKAWIPSSEGDPSSSSPRESPTFVDLPAKWGGGRPDKGQIEAATRLLPGP